MLVRANGYPLRAMLLGVMDSTPLVFIVTGDKASQPTHYVNPT